MDRSCDECFQSIDNLTGLMAISMTNPCYYASRIEGTKKFFMYEAAFILGEDVATYIPRITTNIDYAVPMSEHGLINCHADDVACVISLVVNDEILKSPIAHSPQFSAYLSADEAEKISEASRIKCQKECDRLNNLMIIESQNDEASYKTAYNKAPWYVKLFLKKP